MKECVRTAELDEQEIQALKATWKGEATEFQQRLTIQVIVNKLCRADDLLYVPDSFDQTAFLQGRGFVGSRIVKAINTPIRKLEEPAK